LKLGGSILKSAERVRQGIEEAFAMFPRLAERRTQSAGTLSGGEQQMLSIARALMMRPKLLMLDEPSLGLAPRIVDLIYERITALKSSGLTLLIVEQSISKALAVSDRAYVFTTGTVRLEGKSSDLANDMSLVRTYLGG